MKIGVISTVQGHQWPGSEYLWSACAERLLAMNHEVVVCASADLSSAAPLQNLRSKGAVVELIPPAAGRVGRLRQRFFNPVNVLARRHLDMLVVSSGSPYDPVFLPAVGQFLRNTGVPIILICHFNAETFWVDDVMRETMSAIFQKARATVFVSQENKRLTERQLAMTIPRAQVIVPPLCLDHPELLPWPEKLDDGPWRFACVARLEPRWKGQDVLFEVLADGRWRERNYRLALYGQGAEEGYLKSLCRFYALEKQVIFAGFARPADIWRDNHLQLLAARGEGGPMVITEGMICGRVAVATRCGFIGDYVEDAQTGFLATFATAECFGAKMEEAWNQREHWQAMGIRAHQAISRRMADFNAPERLLKLILAQVN